MMDFRGRIVLVTGGAGFIGSALVKRLVAEGARVTVVDDLSSGRRSAVPSGAKLLVKDFVIDLESGADTCFHLACRNIIASVGDPETDLRVNAFGALRLMRRLPSSTAVVYTSSASVYGAAKPPFDEGQAPQPSTPYAVSKLAAEGYTRLYQPNAVVLRLSNVYGPGQAAGVGVANVFFDAARTGQPMCVHGDGAQTRDFTYVDDVVDALLLAASQQTGGTYNIGTGVETSVSELAHAIATEVGHAAIERVDDRPMLDTIRARSVMTERAERELGWHASTSLRAGIVRWLHAANVAVPVGAET